MADEDEIDILGDFNLSGFSTQNETNMLDSAPLVSQNSDLLNCDYTIHPQWLLDKPSANPDNWYETNSAASTSDMSEVDTLGHISTENYITDESGWTEKEKNLLHRGIEIFGKSSVRLSQFVGSKTASEVKYYLKNFFSENQHYYQHTASEALIKNIPDSVATDVLDANQIPASIEEVIAVVSTGSPTVQSTISKKIRRKSSSSTGTANISPKDVSPSGRSLKTKLTNAKTKLTGKINATKRKIEFKDTKPKYQQRRDQKSIKFKFKTKFKLDVKKGRQESEKNVKEPNKVIQNKELKIGKIEITTGKGLSVPICEGEEIVKIQNVEDDSSDISVDVEDEDDIILKAQFPVYNTETAKIPVSNTENQIKAIETPKLLTAPSHSSILEGADRYIDFSQMDKDLAHQLTSLKEPNSELLLDKHNVTKLEKFIHNEFFEGRSSKTPERYLKIRNHIISSWQSTKPSYVTKTSMRLGLRNCGDVTCISRIHYLLEQIGAINFGCEQTKYERPLYNKIQMFNLPKNKSMKGMKKLISREPTELGPRQRIKKFTHDGEGGCTLVHGDQGEIINTTIVNEEPAKPRSYIKKPSIRLIYCRPFTDEKPQAYAVRLSLSTLLLMDFHAHTYLTEVMGLVGGYWDCHGKALTILCYEPCKNIASSSTHCDMCPISQARAAENIHNKNLQILGWFHSHPTFAPEPSQQDLDTQKFVQQWIGHNKPCIGLILTPFSFNGALISSPYRCLMVDKKPNFDDQIVPYRFKVDIMANDFNVQNFLQEMRRIVFSEDKYLKDKRIPFHKPYFQDLNISHLDKFISSVNMHLAKNGALSKTTCDHIIKGIKNLLITVEQLDTSKITM